MGGGGCRKSLYLQSGCGICKQWKLVSEKGKLKVLLGCERAQVVCVKMYKGQIYIKYDAPNTYI